MSDISIVDIVRKAKSGAYNFVRILPNSVIINHRGHSGPDDDFIEIELASDNYLKLSAEVRNLGVHEETDNYTISSRPETLDGRLVGPPHHNGGHMSIEGSTMAYEFSTDSLGREAIFLSLGYETFAMLKEWSVKKMELCKALSNRNDWERNHEDPFLLLWPVLDATPDLSAFDLEEWAREQGISLKSGEPQPPVEDERYSAKALTKEFKQLRYWAKKKGYFQSDDPQAPDSFYCRSEYNVINRIAIETDGDLKTRFVVDRLDGRGFVQVSDAKFVIDCFIAPNATAHLDEDLKGFDEHHDEPNS